jgi:hypothetical protein
MGPLHFLSLADFKTVRPPGSGGDPERLSGPQFEVVVAQVVDGPVLALLILLGLTFVGLRLLQRSSRRPRRPSRKAPKRSKPSGPYILVDGSNVMHWQDNQPKLAPLLAVIGRLQALGYVPGVVFDANAGWKLFDHYMDEGDLAHLLHIPREQERAAGRPLASGSCAGPQGADRDQRPFPRLGRGASRGAGTGRSGAGRLAGRRGRPAGAGCGQGRGAGRRLTGRKGRARGAVGILPTLRGGGEVSL